MAYDRLYPLRYHPVQQALWESGARFRVVPAGRRSGKSERAKRYVLKQAYDTARNRLAWPDPRFFLAAPTREQAKHIFWQDLKMMVRSDFLERKSETELWVRLKWGAEIWVVGMDKPERIEGRPWDGGVLDEFANMKPFAFDSNVRPALADRKGWCWLIGVPEGRNHYYDLHLYALSGNDPEWATFSWPSADILDPMEVEAARRQLDPVVFDQEFCACHDPNTLVAYWNGSIRKISDVHAGDVLSTLQDGLLAPTRVLDAGPTGRKKMLRVVLEDGTTFRASSCHKMRLGNEKVELKGCPYLEAVPEQVVPSTKEEAFAALVACSLGDGTITLNNKGYLQGAFYAKNKGDLDDVLRDMATAGFQTTAQPRLKKGAYECYQLQISDSVCRELVKRGAAIGYKPTQDIGVPDWIKKADKSVQRMFIAALWGSEGRTPRPNANGTSPASLMLSMRQARLVYETADLMKSFGLRNVVTESATYDGYATIYTDRPFLWEIGYLYARQKQRLAWLWARYALAGIFKKEQARELHDSGMTWEQVGQRLGLHKNTARQMGLSDSFRVSKTFPRFDEWVEERFVDGKLQLAIVSKEDDGEENCWNILVDSPDHSYVLGNGLDNFNSFVNFTGRAYYAFQEAIHCRPLKYKPNHPLAICFDFNVEPGVAVICQEQELPGQYERRPDGEIDLSTPVIGTGVIGEVHIPRNSNTEAVCKRIIKDWGEHTGPVKLYGDATGGASGSAKVAGSDWDIIKTHLRPVFKDKLEFRVPSANPAERARVNAVNSRLLAGPIGEQVVRMMIDPKCGNMVRDLEGVKLLDGGSGEIDKKANPKLSHLSDALGYYLNKEFPVRPRTYSVGQLEV